VPATFGLSAGDLENCARALAEAKSPRQTAAVLQLQTNLKGEEIELWDRLRKLAKHSDDDPQSTAGEP
jgi:hypothetical protein